MRDPRVLPPRRSGGYGSTGWPHGHEGVGALHYCVTDYEFQLPGLVPASRKPRKIVPFHPKINSAYVASQTLKSVQRGRQKRQACARETGQ